MYSNLSDTHPSYSSRSPICYYGSNDFLCKNGMPLNGCAVGSVYGQLDTEQMCLRLSDITVPVTLNHSFKRWLQFNELPERAYTFAALPKTFRTAPFIGYELLGVDPEQDDRTDSLKVVGECIYQNRVYGFVLIRVRKGEDKSFVIKLDGDLDIGDAEGRHFQIKAKREGNAFQILRARVLNVEDLLNVAA